MATHTLAQALAIKIHAIANCRKKGNSEWMDRHTDAVHELVKEYLPCGSGIDIGASLDLAHSQPNRLIILTPFHHMNDAGFYDGWTHHSIIVTPSLAYGFDVRVTGRDRNGIKEYLGSLFQDALSAIVVTL